LTDDQRAALNEEAQQILEEIDATAQNTEFNGTTLLDGSVTNVPLGTEGQNIQLNINESTVGSLGLNGLDIGTQAGATAALDQVETALGRVSQNRAALGAQESRFQRAIEQREIGAENTAASESAIRDLDYARQFVEQTRNEILLQTGISALAQSNLQGQVAAGLLGA
jgi:flagellin